MSGLTPSLGVLSSDCETCCEAYRRAQVPPGRGRESAARLADTNQSSVLGTLCVSAQGNLQWSWEDTGM